MKMSRVKVKNLRNILKTLIGYLWE